MEQLSMRFRVDPGFQGIKECHELGSSTVAINGTSVTFEERSLHGWFLD